MARVSETKFAREVLFRINKGYPHAGKVFRGRTVEQRPSGCITVEGVTSGRPYDFANYGTELRLHEKETTLVLSEAGLDLAANDAYVAEHNATIAMYHSDEAARRKKQAAEQLVRDAAPELLAQLIAAEAALAYHSATRNCRELIGIRAAIAKAAGEPA